MLLAEPPRSEYDWNFRLGSVPVRVHPYLWLVGVVLGYRNADGKGLVIWLMALFVSILVHEMGHAIAIRYFGWNPHVVLHSFGGLAIYDPGFQPLRFGARRKRLHGPVPRIVISLAGPFAGFLLALLVLLALFSLRMKFGWWFGGRQLIFLPGDKSLADGAWILVHHLLSINLLWGLMNLLPVAPLDGGNIARELLLHFGRDGHRRSLILSCVVGSTIAFAAIAWPLRSNLRPEWMVAILFGYLAYSSYQQLIGPYGGWHNRSPW